MSQLHIPYQLLLPPGVCHGVVEQAHGVWAGVWACSQAPKPAFMLRLDYDILYHARAWTQWPSQASVKAWLQSSAGHFVRPVHGPSPSLRLARVAASKGRVLFSGELSCPSIILTPDDKESLPPNMLESSVHSWVFTQAACSWVGPAQSGVANCTQQADRRWALLSCHSEASGRMMAAEPEPLTIIWPRACCHDSCGRDTPFGGDILDLGQ